MTESNRPYIECRDLFKIFKREELEVVGLRGLDLEVQSGEFLAIVGSSGSGKSTLLNVLAGLDTPSAGQVYVGTRDLLEMTEKERADYRRSDVGFLWQATSRNLLPYLNARDNVELPMAISGVPAAQRKERAMELLNIVNLANKSDRLPDQLSSGEQQRVAISVALGNRPPLLLADEPTGELDTRSADDVFKALRTMCRLEGTTVVAVTHYPGVSEFVDRMVHIRDGRIASETVIEPTYQASGGTIKREYLVVDQVGRLQLPQESMEKFGFKGRARIEIQANGALIQPPEKDA